MGLPPCNPSYKYKNYFFTAGPRPVEGDYRKQLEDVIYRHFPNITSMRVVQEISDDGYYHFHGAIMLSDERRWVAVKNAIRNFVTNLGATKSASCRFFYVRKGEDPQCIRKYIMEPTKVKQVDEDGLEFEPREPFVIPLETEGDRNFIEFIRAHHVCPKCQHPKPVFSRARSNCPRCP